MRARRSPAFLVVLSVLALGSALLVAAPSSPAAAQTASQHFTDVQGGPHADAIDLIYEAGVTEGCDATRYCPGQPVTRAQMASFLARALELPPPSGHHFGDIAGLDDHEDNINSLYEAGITEGCTANSYCPLRPVTRAEMASFLARAFDIPASSTTYFTAGGPAHSANINAIADAGVTNGCRALGLEYCPDEDLQRDQMATFLARALELVPRVSIPMLLTPGESGSDVTDLQRQLSRLGYHIDATVGHYGNTTEHAVRAFQQVEGISVDGIYGPETRGAMMDGTRGVMASFTTPLQPGQSRNVNIHLGADYVHGDVIRPGERYSLNAGIGPRTRDRGFVEDGFIDEGDVISVVGGGVSQLATTMVNTAWFSGIELIDFRQHTIYFVRYPMCREGTLDGNRLDVVVENNSPHAITISSTYTSSGVTLTFVGEPWAEVSSWTGDPSNISGPGGAFSITCGRTITFPDGHSHSEDYSWRYHEGYPG